MEMAIEAGRIDLASRVSARATAVGVALAVVSLSLLLSLGGGLGLIPVGGVLDAEMLRRAGAGFALWASLSWIAAAFLGAFVASVTARSTAMRDGLLHGVATWAGACLSLAILLCVWFMAAVPLGLATKDLSTVLMTPGAFWAFFFADALALSAALLGGALGARSETKIAARLPSAARQPEKGSVASSRPAPQPT